MGCGLGVRRCLGAQTEIGGVKVRAGGFAKGSGMIHPNMATMLCVITTDAAVEERLWADVVRAGAINSFNQVRAWIALRLRSGFMPYFVSCESAPAVHNALLSKEPDCEVQEGLHCVLWSSKGHSRRLLSR